MKLCFIAEANTIHGERWVFEFLNRGNELFWLSLSPPLRPLPKNLTFIQLRGNSKYLTVLKNIFCIKQLIRKIQPDILHAHYAGVSGMLGALADYHPFIITPWGDDVLLTPFYKKPFVQYILKKADSIMYSSEDMKKHILSLGGQKNKLWSFHWGTDIKKLRPMAKDKELLRTLNIQEGEQIVISVRNFEKIYDIPTLIRAIPLILEKATRTKFIIAGRGSLEEHIKNIAQTLGITKAIIFTGWIPNTMIPLYFNLADVYVSTSLSDGGLASSTVDAMACAVPVVISDIHINLQWVQDNVNAFVFRRQNHTHLAERVIEALENEEKRRVIGSNGRKLVETHLNYEREMNGVEKLYRSLKNTCPPY